MKKHGLWNRFKMILRIASRYAAQHSLSMEAMEGLYHRHLPNQGKAEMHFADTLKITPYGSIYKITQLFYLNNELMDELSWLATYGWHSNGQLIEIGGDRYCIFDPLQKTMYVEGYNNVGRTTLETYTQI